MTRFSPQEYRQFVRSVRDFTEREMDQWENWCFGSKFGDVFVSIARRPWPGTVRQQYDDLDADGVFGPAEADVPQSSFAESLKDWTDWDNAAFGLGQSIGLFDPADEMRDHKGVFWSANPVGDSLHNALLQLVNGGILEQRDEPDTQFRRTHSSDGQTTS